MKDRTLLFNQKYLSKIFGLYKVEPITIFDTNFISYQFINKSMKDVVLVLQTNDIYSNCFLDKLSLFDSKQKNGKCYIFIMQKESAIVEECTIFNGKSFVHFVFLDFQKNKIMYDKNFYYFGCKHIKKLMEICEEVFVRNTGDGTMCSVKE